MIASETAPPNNRSDTEFRPAIQQIYYQQILADVNR